MFRPYAKDMDPEVRHYLAEVIGCLQELVKRSPDAEFRGAAGLALVTIKANLMGREGQNETDDEEDCDHGDTDGNECLDCGKDLTEDRVAAAYDRWKDSKYE